ncbi:MAG: KEOPS complex subunit Cgi121 [Methanolinea sp.]|nr:KEOPS complex subunit Cgi121 [Methanolinea sp.]
MGDGGDCVVRQVRVLVRDVGEFLDAVGEIANRTGTHIVFFDADKVAGRAHVESALRHAFRARETGSMISSRVEVEALLYAAGTRQIVEAVRFGLHEGANRAYLALCPGNDDAWREIAPLVSPADDEDWDALPPEKVDLLCTLFSISPRELEVCGAGKVRELVLERVALLDVYK